MSQPVVRSCPKCNGVAHESTPQGLTGIRGKDKYFTCSVCGLMTNQDGNAVIKSTEEIEQINSIAAGARKTAESIPELDKMSPAGQALFQAKLTEMALQMWLDGYKHGVLCDAVGKAYDEKVAKEGDNAKQES